jgi:hypothetical protein
MAEETASLTHGAPMESRAREDMEAEPPGEGEPTPDALIASGDAGGHGLAHDDVELRSEIARHLRPHAFPATRDALVTVAEQEGASDAVVALLRTLPAGVEFAQVSDVWRALGGEVEHREEREDEHDEDTAPAPASLEEIVVVEPVLVEEIDVVVDEPAPAERARIPAEAAAVEAVADDEPESRPGCNPAAIVLNVALDTGDAVARVLRRVLP